MTAAEPHHAAGTSERAAGSHPRPSLGRKTPRTVQKGGVRMMLFAPDLGRGLVLLLVAAAVLHTADAITFPCIAPLLGPTIPSAPSREPSPARSRTPDAGQEGLCLSIRGGDLAATKTPRTRSDSGADSTGSDLVSGDSSLGDVSAKLKAMSIPMHRPVVSTGTRVMLRFRINYSTRWGENVIIVGSTEELGGVQDTTEEEVRKAIAAGKGKVMRYIADGNWEFATLMGSAPTEVTYRYALVRERGDPLVEGGIRSGRVLDLDECVRRSRVVRRSPYTVGSGGSSSSLRDASSRESPLQVEVRDQWRVSRGHGEDVLLRTDAICNIIYGTGRAEAIEEAMLDGTIKHVSALYRKPAPVKMAEGAAASGAGTGSGGAGKGAGGGGGGGGGGAGTPAVSVPMRITVERTRVPHGCAMAVECETLLQAPAVMSCDRYPEWVLEMEPHVALLPAAYKFVVVNLTSGEVVGREDGAARTLHPSERLLQQQSERPVRDSVCLVSVRDEATTDRWPEETLRPLRCGGVSLHLASLRSVRGMGVGEFPDIKRLADMCKRTGLRFIQLLPVTDTCAHPHAPWLDLSPYSAISAHALNPLYLRLSALPGLPKDVAREVQVASERLNARSQLASFTSGSTSSSAPHIGGKPGASMQSMGSGGALVSGEEDVLTTKHKLLRRAYEASGKKVVESAAFAKFVNEHAHWLKPYALFCVLRDVYGNSDASQWGDMGRLSYSHIETLASPGGSKYAACRYWFWLQYHLHHQLHAASSYAASNGIAIMGDLPIGIHRHAVDVWVRPDLFRKDRLAGAPPDLFSNRGQNWKLPVLDWERMARDGHSWWAARLKHMNLYFSALRVDHILGFFRLWELPAHAVTGLSGHFNPSHPVSAADLDARGLWDRQRLSTPYIRAHLLQRRFGKDWGVVAKRFLEEAPHGAFVFRAGLDTEVAIADAIEREPMVLDGMDKAKVLEAVLDCMNDRCLVRDEGAPEERFYPRYRLWETDSFAELGPDWQVQLRELHDQHFSWHQEEVNEATACHRLRVLQSATNMLLVGEDMGQAPNCLSKVLEGNSIPGLRLPRVGKEAPTSSYPYLSVVASSTHDMSTLAGWWKDLSRIEQDEYWTLIGASGSPPASDSSQNVSTAVTSKFVEQLMQSPSMLAILPLQDLLDTCPSTASADPLNDQVNFPSDQDKSWRWRCALDVEDIVNNSGVLRGQQQVVGYLATASDRLFSKDVTLFFYHHANTPTDFIANIKRMVESSNRKCE